MSEKVFKTMDGNEAAATIAYKTNEVIAIYPITPASPMGELVDAWAAKGKTNIWGNVPKVEELQSEGGAAGAVHGALQSGALTTTFTASQGLLLMYPNMFKIAGELTSTVFHIAARTIATHALSIFGDHSDVMAVRASGWGMLFSSTVQEAMDFALLAQMITLRSRVPFLHVMDGFRTTHEIDKIQVIPDEQIRALIDEELVQLHRQRALAPEKGFIRGTAQNPDTFFQAREAINPFYDRLPEITIEEMEKFYKVVGRKYQPYEYVGAPDAERVIVIMGSGATVVHESVLALNKAGEKVGLVKVRLYRPFSPELFIKALPETVKAIAVLDRTKEPGALGEPLYQDVSTAMANFWSKVRPNGIPAPLVIGGRYGLASKEFNPPMVKGVFDELKREEPKNSFSVGIIDDLTHRSIDPDPNFRTESPKNYRAVFWGLGSDGTVGANKNSIKIIGENTDYHVQGYFIYDSKKAGARTISHLRFGPDPIIGSYQIDKANFVAIHQFNFLEKYPVLKYADKGTTVLLNSPYPASEVWDHIPRSLQKEFIEKDLKLYVIDAYKLAKEVGLGRRINIAMQTAFFMLTGMFEKDEAVKLIKKSIEETYSKYGEKVVEKNKKIVDLALEAVEKVEYPKEITAKTDRPPVVPPDSPEFVKNWTARLIAEEGDLLPVSTMTPDGTFPSATARWEKRNLAQEVPVWEPDLCIQCGKCVLICPHSVIRSKRFAPEHLENAPEGFKTMPAKWKGFREHLYTIQVSVEDCTGCRLCVEICPAHDKKQPERKALNMHPQLPVREEGIKHWEYFLKLPEHSRVEEGVSINKVKDVQLLTPLFEFSGACAGCGETPYLKLLSQLFGDRVYIANATGCSSIYGGNLPTTPWAVDKRGYGPAWSNSLFEDNAEFGLGMRLAIDKQRDYAVLLLKQLSSIIPENLIDQLINADQTTDQGIEEQRERVQKLKELLNQKLESHPDLKEKITDLLAVSDMLVHKTVWIVGGDGWAYDIGFGGLDHVLSTNYDVNILVMDTEVYSNTGGQTSKATPRAAIAKFSANGKRTGKKDLAMMAISYGHVYVARVAMSANEQQTLKAFLEADSYHEGPSIIIAHSPCIAQGFDLSESVTHQRLAVETGYWPIFRYDPRLKAKGKNPMQLDMKPPKAPLQEYLKMENRFRRLLDTNPEEAQELLNAIEQDVQEQFKRYQSLAGK